MLVTMQARQPAVASRVMGVVGGRSGSTGSSARLRAVDWSGAKTTMGSAGTGTTGAWACMENGDAVADRSVAAPRHLPREVVIFDADEEDFLFGCEESESARVGAYKVAAAHEPRTQSGSKVVGDANILVIGDSDDETSDAGHDVRAAAAATGRAVKGGDSLSSSLTMKHRAYKDEHGLDRGLGLEGVDDDESSAKDKACCLPAEGSRGAALSLGGPSGLGGLRSSGLDSSRVEGAMAGSLSTGEDISEALLQQSREIQRLLASVRQPLQGVVDMTQEAGRRGGERISCDPGDGSGLRLRHRRLIAASRAAITGGGDNASLEVGSRMIEQSKQGLVSELEHVKQSLQPLSPNVDSGSQGESSQGQSHKDKVVRSEASRDWTPSTPSAHLSESKRPSGALEGTSRGRSPCSIASVPCTSAAIHAYQVESPVPPDSSGPPKGGVDPGGRVASPSSGAAESPQAALDDPTASRRLHAPVAALSARPPPPHLPAGLRPSPPSHPGPARRALAVRAAPRVLGEHGDVVSRKPGSAAEEGQGGDTAARELASVSAREGTRDTMALGLREVTGRAPDGCTGVQTADRGRRVADGRWQVPASGDGVVRPGGGPDEHGGGLEEGRRNSDSDSAAECGVAGRRPSDAAGSWTGRVRHVYTRPGSGAGAGVPGVGGPGAARAPSPPGAPRADTQATRRVAVHDGNESS